MMKNREDRVAFASSSLPDPTDDEAFRREMAFVDSEAEVIAFAKEFGIARTTVRGWKSGRYAPHPSLRLSYCTWLRQRAGELAAQAGAATLQAQMAHVARAAGKLSNS
jgi:DNA-binding XRE family transcriptional regulator